MKHSVKITLVLLVIFLLAQFVGIGVLYNYIDFEKSAVEGKTVFEELPIGERPPIEEATSFFWVILAVLIGTGILLLLIKFRVYFMWRIWFLLAVVLALMVSWSAFIKEIYALFLALFFGLWKIFRPNILVQNFTEIFIYGGLAAIFVPLFSLWSVIILLLLISIYDMYAVWKSKHMIKLAKSQAKAKIFAGLLIPYKFKLKGKSKGKKTAGKIKIAVLGGGDIGFPLIFTGVILKVFGLWQALLIPVFTGTALLLLLLKGKEKKFYPAMPFITAGCLVGLGVVLLIGLL
jgi:presenilin-like A22 family membrane protease